jgi:hypothetical protein
VGEHLEHPKKTSVHRCARGHSRHARRGLRAEAAEYRSLSQRS